MATPAAEPARSPGLLLAGGALAFVAALLLTILLRTGRALAFLARQAGLTDEPMAGQVVHRSALDAWCAAGIVALALVCAACGLIALRPGLAAPDASRWPGVAGGVLWVCGVGLLAFMGPMVLRVFADVLVGVVCP